MLNGIVCTNSGGRFSWFLIFFFFNNTNYLRSIVPVVVSFLILCVCVLINERVVVATAIRSCKYIYGVCVYVYIGYYIMRARDLRIL